MSDCFVLYLLLTCMKKKTSGADKFTNNNMESARLVNCKQRRKIKTDAGCGAGIKRAKN